MGSIIKIIVFLISFEFFLYVLSAYILLIAGMVSFFKLQLWDAFSLIPSKVFMGLALLNRVSALLYELKKKKRNTLVSIGIIAAVIGLLLNSLYRFEGIAGLGEGENLSGYNSMARGPLAGIPKLHIAVGAIEGDILKSPELLKVRLLNENEKPITLSPGNSAKWSSLKALFPAPNVSVLHAGPAPRFLIKNYKGKELHSAFVKLSLNPAGREDYFRSPALPHRFYMSMTGRDEKPFHLKIMRGKLIIEKKEIGIGQDVEFEGFTISFPEISKWVELEVKHYPGNMVALAGFVIGMVGVALKIVKRNTGRGGENEIIT